MKKKTDTAFANILNTLHEKDITTKKELISNPQLYTDFWLAADEFCRFALHSKTSKANKKRKLGHGNTSKIEQIENSGILSRHDIEIDCLTKIIGKLDLILCKPIEGQIPYCYTICNNIVNDSCDKLPPIITEYSSKSSSKENECFDSSPLEEGLYNDSLSLEEYVSSDDFTAEESDNNDGLPKYRYRIVSLYDKVTNRNNLSEEEAYTYEEIIPDNTYNPEHRTLLHNKILDEISLLSFYPGQLMARLACFYLDLKPRELAEMILSNGWNKTFEQILTYISIDYNINLADIQKMISSHSSISELIIMDCDDESEPIKTEFKSEKELANHISRQVYRAKKHINS